MQPMVVLGLVSFVLCLVATPLCRNLFLRAGLVDHPDGDRKFHARAVPRMGGIPIVLSYAGALLIVFLLHPSGGRLYIQHRALFRALLPGATLIFVTGLLDDLIDLKPWAKLGGQLAGTVLAVYLGARLSLSHLPAWVSFVLSIGWLVGCTNAVNLIDGMDGLAAGVGLLATLTTFFVAVLSHNNGLALVSLPMAGCLLGFLRYNFSPASIFLGDCGSLTIGFTLGCFGLIWSQRTGTMIGMAGPLMALALPLIDIGLAIGRRFLRNVPIFKGDRGHIHHRVLNLGFSPRSAALVLYCVCVLAALLAVLESFSQQILGWTILVLFIGLVLLGINRLRYVEFIAARRTLSRKTVLRAVKEEIFLEELTLLLSHAETIDSWWKIIRDLSVELRFASAHLEIDGRIFHDQFGPSVSLTDKPYFRIQIGFGDRGHLLLTRMPEEFPPRILMSVLDRLHKCVAENSAAARLTANDHSSTAA